MGDEFHQNGWCLSLQTQWIFSLSMTTHAVEILGSVGHAISPG